jgi:hypothetical protein
MDYKTAIYLAKQRMKEIGKIESDYHIEAITVIGTSAERSAKKIKINAPNRIYFLVDYQKLKGLYIISETGYFNSDDATNNTIQEFSGPIEIGQLPAKTWSLVISTPGGETLVPMDFIKVTIF